MDHIEVMEKETHEMSRKRKFFTESLRSGGVTQSISGKQLHLLSCEELKQEWINHQAGNIDIGSGENKWF
ncbi:hypothetical protein J14TS2_16420 [Bacillus sp. J14TS2]|uniref:hypothetical protein n=1 Tax=Bacillus sp. J14TS2 TaxID=2807188 RepID=UPI001AFECBA9|nr:hypothetical protein [Bacillus sp. J14TS2]GIN71167.1 hypothetical protein J14TS2_16420 [Bacillus sp. J14TS2]